MFMIFLILSLPINSASVFGAVIQPPVRVYGSSGEEGFRGLLDTTTIEIIATIPEDPEISAGQVKILEDPTAPVECELTSDSSKTYRCVREIPERYANRKNPIQRYTVQIFDDAGSPISSPVQGTAIVDANPPKYIDNTT